MNDKSSESSTVPSDWKKANVPTIFKKGDKSSSPISVTSQVCKVLIILIISSLKMKEVDENE
jgi:hypothetical protein